MRIRPTCCSRQINALGLILMSLMNSHLRGSFTRHIKISARAWICLISLSISRPNTHLLTYYENSNMSLQTSSQSAWSPHNFGICLSCCFQANVNPHLNVDDDNPEYLNQYFYHILYVMLRVMRMDTFHEFQDNRYVNISAIQSENAVCLWYKT